MLHASVAPPPQCGGATVAGRRMSRARSISFWPIVAAALLIHELDATRTAQAALPGHMESGTKRYRAQGQTGGNHALEGNVSAAHVRARRSTCGPPPHSSYISGSHCGHRFVQVIIFGDRPRRVNTQVTYQTSYRRLKRLRVRF